jgi:cation:H+ antiporter
MWLELAAILGGFVLLTWSADRFVEGASAIAVNLDIPPLVIGLTIVSIGTSAPEIIVSAVSAWQGNSALAIGNALGSNIVNTGLILGLTALIVPLNVHSSIVRRELPLLMLVMVVALLLLLDGRLDRIDGIVLLTGMVAVLGWVTWQGIRAQGTREPMASEFAGEMPVNIPMARAIRLLVSGGVVLLVSSRLLVWGAVAVAQALGVSELLIGLTVVALGTSLPELAATLVSALRNEHDIAIGNVVGSNIFNLLAVLGLPGLIHPVTIDRHVLTRDYPVMAGLTVLLFVMAYGFTGPGRLNRLEGAALLVAFAAYQVLLYFSELH